MMMRVVKKRVGLIVLVKLKDAELAAVLQGRGFFNSETRKPESYPGICQVTVHGKLENNESAKQALFREIREELGRDFEREVKKAKILEIHRFHESRHQVITYAAKLPAKALKAIRPGSSSGGLRLITQSEINRIKTVKPAHKIKGVLDRNAIVMFSDELEAVKKAFKVFS